MIDGRCISCEIAQIWISLDFTDDQWTLVQVMVWCCQETSHYLNQCWSRSLTPYGITRTQWIKPKGTQSNNEAVLHFMITVESIRFCLQRASNVVSVSTSSWIFKGCFGIYIFLLCVGVSQSNSNIDNFNKIRNFGRKSCEKQITVVAGITELSSDRQCLNAENSASWFQLPNIMQS